MTYLSNSNTKQPTAEELADMLAILEHVHETGKAIIELYEKPTIH